MTSSLQRLVVGAAVVAGVEVAATPRQRRRGLLGRDGIQGALLLAPCRSVHTVGMRFPIDVAYLRRSGEQLEVVRVATMSRNRIGRPVLRSQMVLEAEAGKLAAWGVRTGSSVALVEVLG